MSEQHRMRIGDLAAAAGVTRSLIRYYEACGLLAAPPRARGARRYHSDALEQLQQVLVIRRLGLSIAETHSALADGQGAMPAIAAAHVAALDDEIRQLRVRRALLRHAGSVGSVAPDRYARVLAKIGPYRNAVSPPTAAS